MSNSRRFDRPMVYRIRVYGRLEPKWSGWFDDCQLTPKENGETILTCLVTDQAALYGLLARIGNLGLPLLGVICEEEAKSVCSTDKRSVSHEN